MTDPFLFFRSINFSILLFVSCGDYKNNMQQVENCFLLSYHETASVTNMNYLLGLL